MQQIVPSPGDGRIRVSQGVLVGVEPPLDVTAGGGCICYTARMFIHRVFITGRSDRGAWPWRKPVCLNT